MLKAISPVDGRYASKVSVFQDLFSEFGLIKYRVFVEIQYLKALLEYKLPELASFDRSRLLELDELFQKFSESDAAEIKSIERTTNHDVKAVEYFLKRKLEDLDLGMFKEFIHFGLTSQDINNTAFPLILKQAMVQYYYPALEELISDLENRANEWFEIPMLARTHGQPASPTKLGKEIKVFSERLSVQLDQLKKLPHRAKFGGATGNLNAHYAAYPDRDWISFANFFVEHFLNLERSQTTTQIAHYDNMAAIFHNLMRINNILIDFARDAWTYISMDYFTQKTISGEVGSSAMPHKVNPIDFENAEGNLGIANAIFSHLASTLPISRLQRDLTDSTVLRNMGVPVAHTFIAFASLRKGIGKLLLNEKAIQDDLNTNWSVIAEGIQTILRREGIQEPYELLKSFTRGKGPMTEKDFKSFIDGLKVGEKVKTQLRRLTPVSYTGKT